MGARHPLPYAYAKAHTLLLEDDGQQLVLWAPETISLPSELTVTLVTADSCPRSVPSATPVCASQTVTVPS